MRRPGRKLTAGEAAAWAKVTKTVMPLDDKPNPPRDGEGDRRREAVVVEGALGQAQRQPAGPLHLPAAGPPPRAAEVSKPGSLDRHGLDAGWDRRLARGLVQPDFTLDLHGATLDGAHARLDQGLALALSQGARVVLVITGRLRPSEDRGSRGVIRRKFMDWLSAGPHAGRIAAVRPAHVRHGGAGAVYVVLKRGR